VWSDVGLDFIEVQPRVGGKSVILTLVDRFSKYYHFIPLAHPYSAESVAQAFFTKIVRLHRIPQSMVSHRDSVFTSTFWRELMRHRPQAAHDVSLPPVVRWKNGGSQRSHHHVPPMFHGGSTTSVAAMATMGGVHLQYGVSIVAQGHSFQGGLR
jgi:hypothetical protein